MLINQDLIQNFGDNRLIPLNKAFPNIPQKDKFRPILVQSPIMKWLELRFLKKFQQYCEKKIIKEQFGFVEGTRTLFIFLTKPSELAVHQKEKQKDSFFQMKYHKEVFYSCFFLIDTRTPQQKKWKNYIISAELSTTTIMQMIQPLYARRSILIPYQNVLIKLLKIQISKQIQKNAPQSEKPEYY
ncbi:unnamed protein product [Paramecium pentaurelia]|uniref:Uncharacterized protein n=1 Tax=Paramecium pentaurelia TaxID=43138 RepID=A0A8S1YHY8_9CILI|nr:unnamed protein product [Paramecium pentaurelia]